MKTLRAMLLISAVGFACTTHEQQGAQAPASSSTTTSTPERAPQVEDRTRSALMNSRISDLRVLFQPRAKISELENRKTCLILLSGAVHGQEVLIEGEPSLREVMSRSTYGAKYDGQLRVASHDSIIQTTIVGYDPDKALKIPVHPGDLIFVQGRN